MIRTDKEHRKALQQLEEEAHAMELQRRQLEQMGLTGEEVERAMQPVQSFHEQLKEEVEAYERMKRGDLGTLHSLAGIGQWLIGVRIAKLISRTINAKETRRVYFVSRLRLVSESLRVLAVSPMSISTPPAR